MPCGGRVNEFAKFGLFSDVAQMRNLLAWLFVTPRERQPASGTGELAEKK
jgi:hypothetical protein